MPRQDSVKFVALASHQWTNAKKGKSRTIAENANRRVLLSLFAFLRLVVYGLLLDDQSVLLLGLGVLGFGLATAALEPKLDKRLKAFRVAKDWTFNAVILAFVSGGFFMVYWYLVFAESSLPSSAITNPLVIKYGLIFDVGVVVGILYFVQLSLALAVSRYPKTRLIEILTLENARGILGRLTESGEWVVPIVGISVIEFIWTLGFTAYAQLLLRYGPHVFNLLGWLLFGSFLLSFIGYARLVYGFLPITPDMSVGSARRYLLLESLPLVILAGASIILTVMRVL